MQASSVYENLISNYLNIKQMGNLQCCDNNKTKQLQFQISLLPSTTSMSNEYYGKFKMSIDQINHFAQINFIISSIKSSRRYLQVILDHFQSVDKFVDFIDNEESKPSLTVVQSKVYHLNNSRYDSLDNRNFTYEHAVADLSLLTIQEQDSKNSKEESILNAVTGIQKIRLLQLEKEYGKQNQKEFIYQLYNCLMSFEQLRDLCWNIKPKNSMDEMISHLYYNLPRYIHFLNSAISLSDTVTYIKIKELYHFILRNFCQSTYEGLEKQYSCNVRVTQVQLALYREDSAVVSTTFMPFLPYQEQKFEGNVQRKAPLLKGDEDVSDYQLTFIISPLQNSQSRCKFRHYQFLYYVPFSAFEVERVDFNTLSKTVYLKQIQKQYLINQTLKYSVPQSEKSINHVSINEQNILNELTSLSTTLRTSLSEKYREYDEFSSFHEQQDHQLSPDHLDSLSRSYYMSYIAQKKLLDNQNMEPLLVNSRLKLESVKDEEKPNKIEEAVTEQQYQVQSVLEIVEIDRKHQEQYEKSLQKYIKKHKLQKLQSQIDNIDNFVYLTTLNLSQSWLQKIEHIDCFPNLKDLFLYSNMITKIQGLQNNKNLRLLSLSRNQISRIQNIDHLVHLRSLYITKNDLDADSSQYLTSLPLKKLNILAISFKRNPDESFDILMKKMPGKLKKLIINEADYLSNKTKHNLRKKLKKVEIQYFHW